MNQKSKTTEKSAPSKKSETDETPIEEKNNSDNKMELINTDDSDSEKGKENSEQSNPIKKQDMDQKKHHSELEEFFISALQDIYYAEAAIEEALGKVKSKATTEELEEAIEDHQLVTKKQILRLEKVFKHLGKEAKKKKCDAIDGILKEVDEMVKNTKEGSMTRDVALIIGAQKVEHYEIATYGGLLQIAITLGHDKVADLLETTLDEEEETDEILTEIAEEYVNFEAKME